MASQGPEKAGCQRTMGDEGDNGPRLVVGEMEKGEGERESSRTEAGFLLCSLELAGAAVTKPPRRTA